MNCQNKPAVATCPGPRAAARQAVQTAFERVLAYCESCDSPFAVFERELLIRLATLGACFIRLFLSARHERLDLQPFLDDPCYRAGEAYAPRLLKTAYGEVEYGRQYLQARGEGQGFFPLDVVLGLSDDRLSPWVMQWVARLATRMSFKAAQMVCRAVLQWAPATETIEQVVLGLGRDAAPFLQQLAAPAEDGEVLVIEVDGKCAPTATAAELAKRRGKRRARPAHACRCSCQRHRGRCQRQARGRKKRRKKGDKSKNGKEAVVVVMYTLRRGADCQLHGPVNKKLYATFAGRKAAALWARAEASKRGFGPDTSKTVQIVLDGVCSLRDNLQELFPTAIFTLDVCHVVERLWKLGRHFHAEGSVALTAWVDELKALLYAGRVHQLLERLRAWLSATAKHGPGTKGRRKALAEQIGFFEPRQAMMQYDRWLVQDLVIASGQVEGAVRHLVGERLDCSGMRWIQGKAEAVLHLRCIELNGDWDKFVKWQQRQTRTRLRQTKRCKILSDQPLTIKRAA
jgi:hypothetical protein